MNAAATISPADAAASLALAQESLTPAEVAEHARALALVAASQDGLLHSLVASIELLQRTAATINTARHNQQVVLRHIASLHAAGRKKVARDLLAEAATIELVPEPLHIIDTSTFVPLLHAWPDVFNPKGASCDGHQRPAD